MQRHVQNARVFYTKNICVLKEAWLFCIFNGCVKNIFYENYYILIIIKNKIICGTACNKLYCILLILYQMSHIQKYDVIVVGGGPAGSSAALQAANGGASVLMVEKEPQIATTVRTSGVTWMDTVTEFGIPERCYNPIKNYGFYSPNNSVILHDKIHRAVVLDVRSTYRWLATQAENAGVKIHTGITIKKATRNDDNSITISGTDNTLACGRIIVDASGFSGVIAQSLGLAQQWRRFGVGAEYEMHAENIDIETWWLMVGSMYSPAGYAWIFPVGGDLVRVGVGVAKPESTADPREILDKILHEKTGPVASLGHLEMSEYHYGLIPNGGIDRKSVHNGVILVGDSAGQSNPLVLEGIRFAIRFGRLAGDAAAAAIHNPDNAESLLSSYEVGWRKMAEARIRSAYKVQNRWLALSDEKWDEELNIIKELNVDEFLDFVRADFTMSKIIKMTLRHPRLAVRQLFRLVQ